MVLCLMKNEKRKMNSEKSKSPLKDKSYAFAIKIVRLSQSLFADKKAFAQFMAQTPKAQLVFHQLFVEAVARWHSGQYDTEYNEPWSVFRARVQKAFELLQQQSGDAVVFTSGGVISVMIQAILGFSDAHSFSINAITLNSSVSRVLYRKEEASLHSFNNTAHLDIHNDHSLVTYR